MSNAAYDVMNETMRVEGTELSVRPIRATDADRLARMFGRLSRRSVYFRFFSPIVQLPTSTLVRLADVDHVRREALVALADDEIVAVARYDELAEPRRTGGREAEIAVTVADDWQGRGLGRRLSRRLAALAYERGFDGLVARILPDNRAALALTRVLAPDVTMHFEGGNYEARIPVRARYARAIDRPRVRRNAAFATDFDYRVDPAV